MYTQGARSDGAEAFALEPPSRGAPMGVKFLASVPAQTCSMASEAKLGRHREREGYPSLSRILKYRAYVW